MAQADDGVRGRVEQWNPQVGIVGWAVCGAGETEVELVAGSVVLASERTRVLRPDLKAAVPPHLADEPWVGFRFSPPSMALAASLRPEDRGRPLQVRDAASGAVLPGIELPTGEEMAALLYEGEGRAPLSVMASPDDPRSAQELVEHLEGLRHDASTLAMMPTNFPATAHKGNIEVVSRVRRGLFLIGGWTVGAVPRQSKALVLVEGRKVPGSIFLASYARPDLPADAVAFCGVLRTDANLWRGDQDFILTFGEPERFMRSWRPFKFLELATGLAWLKNATKAEAADKELISQAARIGTDGPVTPEAVGGYASLDRVTIFPDFGALVRGWVLTPRGDLSTVSVAHGTMGADATGERIITQARPDLGAGFPPLADRTGRAGFTALCVGALADQAGLPAVELGLDDDTSLGVPTSAQVLRSGYSANAFGELATHFPAYAREAFFPELCRSFARTAMRQRPRLHHLHRREGAKAVLFGMPLAASDARLAATDIARAQGGDHDLAITLVLGPGHDRAAVTKAVRDVLAEDAVGIVQHDGRAPVARALAELVSDIGVERFVYVQPGCRLSWSAWRQAIAYVEGETPDHPLVFVYREEGPSQIAELRPVGALCWTAAGFAGYAQSATPRVDATLLSRDLAILPDAEIVEDMVVRYHERRGVPLTVEVDAEIEAYLVRARSNDAR